MFVIRVVLKLGKNIKSSEVVKLDGRYLTLGSKEVIE